MPPTSDRPDRSEFPSIAAVLTGDIVGSTRDPAADQRKLLGALRQAAATLLAVLPDAGISKIDIFRGDSWQILVRRPEAALRAALLFRTYLLGGEGRSEISWDTRVGIGTGTVQRVDARQVSRSQGAAFIASGEALDGLAKGRRRMALRPATAGDQPRTEAVFALLDALIQRWTAKQAWAVHGALRELTQEGIAAEFQPPIGQRTAGDHLQKADWDAVETTLHWWEERKS